MKCFQLELMDLIVKHKINEESKIPEYVLSEIMTKTMLTVIDSIDDLRLVESHDK